MVAKVEFPIGKKLFHLVVNPGTWPGARPWTWNWYKLQETSMEHDIPFGNSNRENGTTFLDFPLFLGIFQWDEPTKRVPFTAEPEIPEILSKWKAPHEIRPIRVRHLRGYSRPGSWKICGEMYSTANDPETANYPKMDLK